MPALQPLLREVQRPLEVRALAMLPDRAQESDDTYGRARTFLPKNEKLALEHERWREGRVRKGKLQPRPGEAALRDAKTAGAPADRSAPPRRRRRPPALPARRS